MVTLLACAVVAALPMMLLAGVLLLVERVQEAREVWMARQRSVTDAIHRELGAVVAPVVGRGRGGWRIEVAVPFEDPAIVARVVSTARTAALRLGAADAGLEVVLTAQAPAVRRTHAGEPRRAELARRVA